MIPGRGGGLGAAGRGLGPLEGAVGAAGRGLGVCVGRRGGCCGDGRDDRSFSWVAAMGE